MLPDKIRNSCRDISLENFNPEDGLTKAIITELTYDNMKKQLKGIHDSLAIVACDSFEVKSEPTLFAKGKDESVLYANSSTRDASITKEKEIVVISNGTHKVCNKISKHQQIWT